MHNYSACGVASLHSLSFNEGLPKDAPVRNATRATASYHQRFSSRATPKCRAPRFSSRDPCPHTGVVSTRCSENRALLSRHTVDTGVVSNPSLASVSLPWLHALAGSIPWLPLHHCRPVASLFPSRSTKSHCLLWALVTRLENTFRC